jgi:fumarate reductase flavoprotein subunit
MNGGETMFESDLVVIGAGGAGLAGAVAAAEKGPSVTVIERRGTPGGNTVFAEGLFAVESPLQEQIQVKATREEYFKKALDFSHYKVDARILRAFIDKSGDTIRWLEEKGVRFFLEPLVANQSPLTWHCSKYGGTNVINSLVEECKNLGVRLLYKTRAKNIITEKSGKVTGVIAADEQEEIKIHTRAVIIATGGFGANKKLLRKYCPFYNEQIKNTGLKNVHMGDGIKMATDLGATTEGMGNLQISGPFFRGESQAPSRPPILPSDTTKGARTMASIPGEPTTIWVNKRGERFMAEASAMVFETVNALLRQPEQVCFSIFDNGIVQNLTSNGFTRKYRGREVILDKTTADRELQEAAERGIIEISDSWEKIAEWIGADPVILTAAIDEYNTSCDNGYDQIFGKDNEYLIPLRKPPYYVIKGFPNLLTTLGGLRINHRMEVLDRNNEAIRGLYAAGNDTGGWETDTYNIHLPGTTFGFAVNSGRIAGESAVKYISEQR